MNDIIRQNMVQRFIVKEAHAAVLIKMLFDQRKWFTFEPWPDDEVAIYLKAGEAHMPGLNQNDNVIYYSPEQSATLAEKSYFTPLVQFRDGKVLGYNNTTPYYPPLILFLDGRIETYTSFFRL